MVTTVLSTYREAKAFPSAIVDTKRLFQFFDHAGVFNQQRIDAENPFNPIVREQYQRYPATGNTKAVIIS
jgi:hypothetical protein